MASKEAQKQLVEFCNVAVRTWHLLYIGQKFFCDDTSVSRWGDGKAIRNRNCFYLAKCSVSTLLQF